MNFLQPQKWSYKKNKTKNLFQTPVELSFRRGGVMVPTYIVMDYSSSIYTDSTWHLGR